MANPWFSPYSEIKNSPREKNQGSLRPTSGRQEHLATCQQTTVNVWSFRCYATAFPCLLQSILALLPWVPLADYVSSRNDAWCIEPSLTLRPWMGTKKRESPSAVRVTLRTLDEDSTYVDWSILNAPYVSALLLKSDTKIRFLVHPTKFTLHSLTP